MAEDNSNMLTRRRHTFVQPLDTNDDDGDDDGNIFLNDPVIG